VVNFVPLFIKNKSMAKSKHTKETASEKTKEKKKVVTKDL
jgi:hypothetical protein